ncbi:MAG: hypothetical protein NC345_13385 [Lachnospira sp.]|nr:hypothetical protein [Lachnospira sp.]
MAADNSLTLPQEEYIHIKKGGKEITVCTMRQKALHTIGLKSRRNNGRLYTRHGKRYYKPYRNYFSGNDKDLDSLVEAGFMDCHKEPDAKCKVYWFNRIGLDWLGNQLGIYIYNEDE